MNKDILYSTQNSKQSLELQLKILSEKCGMNWALIYPYTYTIHMYHIQISVLLKLNIWLFYSKPKNFNVFITFNINWKNIIIKFQ